MLNEFEVAALRQWQPIDTAPLWINDSNQALLGQLNSEGRWVKVSLWEPTWDRASVTHRGATHWLRLPEPPAAEPGMTEEDRAIDYMERLYEGRA